MENKYVCPDVEVLEVAIEKGFADSPVGTGGTTPITPWGAPVRDIDED